MSLFSNSKLHSAWSTRSWEIQAQLLQDSSDLLYDHLRRDFMDRRQSLQANLIEVIKTAGSLKDLQIPLWTYHTTVLPKLPSEDYEKVVGHLRRHGYEWSIGQVNPDFNPEEIELWAWNWQLVLATLTGVGAMIGVYHLQGQNWRSLWLWGRALSPSPGA